MLAYASGVSLWEKDITAAILAVGAKAMTLVRSAAM